MLFNWFFSIAVFTIFPWFDGLYAVRIRGRIQKINPNDGATITTLPGYHREAPIHLTSMHAVMGPTGFVSSIGHNTNLAGGIPCNVLISVGKGCKGPLQYYSQLSDTNLDNTYALLHVVT